MSLPRSDLGLGQFQGEWVEVATLDVPSVALNRNAFLEDEISEDLWWWVAGEYKKKTLLEPPIQSLDYGYEDG